METVPVHLVAATYDVMIGSSNLSTVGRTLAERCGRSQIAVVTAMPIHRHCGKRILASLTDVGFSPRLLLIPDGERVKSLRWAAHLYDLLIKHRYGRGTILIALGGGVIGDLTGFVASTYLRGVDFVQVPTTLVAQVDASIGGKTGVNHPKGKNLIGTFYQPRLVFIDVAALQSLPKRELIGGMAEVVKYGVISDPDLFTYLELHNSLLLKYDLAALEHIVVKSARIKADVVGKDEREAGLRRVLNYGHTLGHAIEAVTGYRRYHHGEAIAIGMQFAAMLAVRLGRCEQAVAHRQERLFKRLGLPIALPPRVSVRMLLSAMALDKKVRDGRVHFVLPERIGRVVVEPVGYDQIKAALQAFIDRAADR
jgi:3-dehydroquinate synthase